MWKKGKVGAATMEKKVGSPSKKLNIELLYDPGIPLLGIYPRKLKTGT